MKFGLIGYGKMGKTIESLGKEQGISFPLIVDKNTGDNWDRSALKDLDAVIEFTAPEAAPKNIRICIDAGVPVVSGTTGWLEQLSGIEAYCRKKNGTLLYASNFSIGVNILFALNRKLAGIMEQFPAYRVRMSETHHVQKLDAPSGTALSLAEQILEENSRYESWKLSNQMNDDPGDRTIAIEALRKDEVKGDHRVSYDSELDTLSISHHAKTRDAFASGALSAAIFIADKKGIFTMEDLLKF